MNKMDKILEVKNFSVSYDDKKILKNINMYIDRNKITAIIGPSGCGKSTFLKSLNMMINEEKGAKTFGDIFFEGKNIKGFEVELLRKNIGLVFQTPTPFPFSIYKNMTYAPIYYGVMDKILEVKNFSVSYDDKKILKNINMYIDKNKITAIIGPSGCGKSTFLKSLNMMINEEKGAKTFGDIFFEGKNIKNFEVENLRKNIGLVFQTPTPFPFSIYKNMTYAPIYYGIKNKNQLDNLVKEKLKLAGLYDEIKDEINKSALSLSGGQQQRLCIARELTVEPEVLLLDEPCSALDIQNTIKIEEMLKNLSKNYTIIIVTHNLAQAKRIADKTAFFFDGELVEYEYTEKIFSNPRDEKTKKYINGIFG